MKKLNLWMLTAILTVSGGMTLTSCTDKSDNPVEDSPSVQTRTTFENQLSATLDKAVRYQNLPITMHATDVLTEFIEQLNMEALSPQIGQIIQSVLTGSLPQTFSTLGDKEAEAREALKNTFSDFQAEQFILTDANKVLSGVSMTFTEGEKEMKYETGIGSGLTIAYQNPKKNEKSELKLNFTGANDGATLFLAKMGNIIPVAVQFPQAISFTFTHAQGDSQEELMTGAVTLNAAEGKKFISVKGSEWTLGVGANSASPNRYELPMAIMHHYADGRVDGEAGLAINDEIVMYVAIQSQGNPYDDAKMEEYKALREKGPLFAAFYEVLSMFNSQSGTAQLKVMGDLEFDLDVKDVAQAMLALGSARQLYDSNPAKEDMDKLTAQLNQSFTFKVKQLSTNIEGEGTLVTANIDGIFRPSVALRFKGETDYKVMWEQMSEKDHANYESLLKSFDEPGRKLEKLFKAVKQKIGEARNAIHF
jgi:hypothetical protein